MPDASGQPAARFNETADIRMDGVAFYRAHVPADVRGTLEPGNLSYCIMVKKGAVTLEIGTPSLGRIDLNEGDAVAISGLATHAFLLKGASEHSMALEARAMTDEVGDAPDLIVGVVRNEMLAVGSMMSGPIVIRAKTDAQASRQLWRVADMLEEEYRLGAQPDQPLVIRRLAELMLVTMLRQSLRDQPDAMSDATGMAPRRRISVALAALLDAAGKGWNLNSLARAAGMSRSRFAENFKAATGQTPAHVIVRLRLADAAQRLMGSGITVEEAAEAAGYASAAAFVRAFRREYGETPARWRRQAGTAVDGLYATLPNRRPARREA